MMPLELDQPLSEEDLRRERARARSLRNSQWWKNRRAKGLCYYCHRRFPPRELTMDHVVPLVRGGKSVRSNLVPCCRECNKAKENLLPLEWQDYLDRLTARTPRP
jgi:5-methylcytosine-specific restriction endonuclease McrA